MNYTAGQNIQGSDPRGGIRGDGLMPDRVVAVTDNILNKAVELAERSRQVAVVVAGAIPESVNNEKGGPESLIQKLQLIHGVLARAIGEVDRIQSAL